MSTSVKFSFCLLLLITSCKSTNNSNQQVIGIARNEKYGAVLYSENNGIYAIEGLQNWDSIYLDKKIKVMGNFQLRVGDDKVQINNLGLFQAQNYQKYYLVLNPIWELYWSDN